MESWVNFSGKEGRPNTQPSTRPGMETGTSGLGGRDLYHCANPSAMPTKTLDTAAQKVGKTIAHWSLIFNLKNSQKFKTKFGHRHKELWNICLNSKDWVLRCFRVNECFKLISYYSARAKITTCFGEIQLIYLKDIYFDLQKNESIIHYSELANYTQMAITKLQWKLSCRSSVTVNFWICYKVLFWPTIFQCSCPGASALISSSDLVLAVRGQKRGGGGKEETRSGKLRIKTSADWLFHSVRESPNARDYIV